MKKNNLKILLSVLVLWQIGRCCYPEENIEEMLEKDSGKEIIACINDYKLFLNKTDTFLGWELTSPNPDALKYFTQNFSPLAANVTLLSDTSTIYEYLISKD